MRRKGLSHDRAALPSRLALRTTMWLKRFFFKPRPDPCLRPSGRSWQHHIVLHTCFGSSMDGEIRANPRRPPVDTSTTRWVARPRTAGVSAEDEAQAGSMFELSFLKNMSFGWAAFVYGFVSDYCVVITMDSASCQFLLSYNSSISILPGRRTAYRRPGDPHVTCLDLGRLPTIRCMSLARPGQEATVVVPGAKILAVPHNFITCVYFRRCRFHHLRTSSSTAVTQSADVLQPCLNP